MEVTYKREMNHNYMIIVSPAGVENGYECRMLAGNCIEGLLKFRIRHQEDKKDFYYEITSKQPLKRLYEQRTIKGDEIRRMLLEIAATLNRVEEYLLREEQILLDPEYIYIEPDQFSVYLCMVPGYTGDFPTAFTGLLEYMLEKVDHKDKDGVVLAYHLYHESLKQNYGMADLLKYLSKEDGPIFESEKPSQKLLDNGEMPEREACIEQQPYAQTPIVGKQLATHQSVKNPTITNQAAGKKRKYIVRNHINEGTKAKKQARDQTGKQVGRKNHSKEIGRLLVIVQRNVRELLNEAVRAVLMAVIGLAALWFLAGVEVATRYGVLIGAAALVLFLLRCIILSKIFCNQEKQSQPLAGNEEHDSWKIDFDTQDHNSSANQTLNCEGLEGETWGYEDSSKEEAGVGEEMGTALLADFSSRGGSAILESLSRDRESIEVSYVPFIIGKHTDMTDYCLKQPTISRLHLRIDKKEGVYIATDLNSTNGTTVEGYHLQANETVSIKNGDVVYLADIGFRFIEPEE